MDAGAGEGGGDPFRHAFTPFGGSKGRAQLHPYPVVVGDVQPLRGRHLAGQYR